MIILINVKEFYKAQDDIEKLKVDHTDHVEATYTKEEVYNKTQTYTKTEIDSKDEAIKDTATTLKSKVDINTENLSLATKELEEARDNKGTLLEKLSEIEDRATENIAKNYISVTGEGNVKVDHCYNGVIKDVALKGKTAYVKTAEVITGTGEVVITPAIDGTLKELNIDGDTKHVKTAEPIAGEGKLTIENSVAGTIPELNIDGKTVLVKHGKSASNNGGELIVTDAIDGPAKGLEIKGNTLLVKHGKEASGIGSVTVSDCIGGDAKGLEIKGNTIMNLCTTIDVLTSCTPRDAQGYFSSTAATYDYLSRDCSAPLKTSTKYTLVVEMKRNTLNTSFRFSNTNYWSDNLNVFSPGEVGVKRLSLTSNSSFVSSLDRPYSVWFAAGDPQTTTGGFEFRFMILEGDWTNKPLPEYFEGMKSVGQESTSSPLASVGQSENGVISVRTTGKNKAKVIDYVSFSDGGVTLNTTNQEISFKGTTNIAVDLYLIDFKEKFTMRKGDKLTFKANVTKGSPIELTLAITVWDGEKFIYLSDTTSHPLIVTATKDNFWVQDIRINAKTDIQFDCNINLQIEQGDISTEFAPYEESMVQVQLPSGMDGANGNQNIQDEFIFGRNVIQKFKKLVLDGTRHWDMQQSDQESTISFRCNIGGKSNGSIMSDSLECFDHALWGVDYEGIGLNTNTSHIIVRVLRSKLETHDVVGFKKWLQTALVTVIYELAEPIIHELPTVQNLSTFKAITTATTTNSIPNGGITLGYPVEEEIVTVPTKYCRLDSLGAGGASAFSPLSSVGQSENGLLTVRTCGKNLCDNSKLIGNSFIMADGSISVQQSHTSDFIRIQKGIQYSFTGKGNQRSFVGFYDMTKTFIFRKENGVFTPENEGYIRVCQLNTITGIDYQVEVGISTEYEEFKESVVQVQLPSSMRSGLGYVEKADRKNERVYDLILKNSILQKTKEIILSDLIASSAEFVIINNDDGADIAFRISPKEKYGAAHGISDSHLLTGSVYQKKAPSIAFHPDGGIYVRVKKSQLTILNDVGFKEYCKSVTIRHLLETPIIHELPNLDKLSTFKGMTKLNTENIVPHGGIKLGYPIEEEVVTIPSEYCRLDSVGANGATQVGEEGLISVRTTGKNLVDKSKIEFVKGYVATDGFFESSITDSAVISNVVAGKYTFSKYIETNRFSIAVFKGALSPDNKEYEFVRGSTPIDSAFTFDVKSGYNTLVVYLNHKNGSSPVDIRDLDIQLEEGNISTEYESYQESVVTLPIPSSMGGLKGTVTLQDEGHLNGKVIQKWLEKDLNELDWFYSGLSTELVSSFYSSGEFQTGHSIICNELPSKYPCDESQTSNLIGIASSGTIRLFIDKTEFNSESPVAFKDFLKTKNYIVYAPIKDPIIHELPASQNLSTFKAITPLATFDNLTHVTIEDELKPSFDMYKPIEEVYMDEWTKHCRLQSVGEEGIVAVKTCGKNLVDKVEFRKMVSGISNGSKQLITDSPCRNVIRIKVKPKTKYSIKSFSKETRFYHIEGNKDLITMMGSSSWILDPYKTLVTRADTHYLSIIMTKLTDANDAEVNILDSEFGDFSYMIFEGEGEATSYEPFHEQITNVPLPASMGSLKGIGDVHDEIDIASGRIIQRVASEKISLFSSQLSKNVDTDTYIGGYFSDQKVTQATLTLCDKLNVEVWSEVANSYKNCLWISGSTSWGFMIEKTLAGNTIISLTEYLNSLDITIEYALKEPIIHEIPPHLVETFSTKTYLSVEDTIAPAIESYYPIEEVVTPTWTKHCRLDSIGDDENGVVTVRTTGKNLFDYREFIGDSIKEIPNGFILVDSHQTNIEVNMQKKVTLSFYIESNGIDHTGAALFGFYDMEGSLSYATPTANFKRTFDNLKSIISLNYCNGTHRITNMQIEEGATATAYEPFKEDISVITLPEGMKALRGIEDISDEVDINAGTITQRVGEITLDGSGTEWATYRDNREHGTYCYRLSLEGIKGGRLLKSSAFENMSPNDNVTRECLYTYAHDNIYIQVTIEKSNYIYSGLEFGKWLQDNPTNVVYELETPIVHTIPKDTLNCYTGVTNLSIADYLNPTLSGKFPVNTPATIGDMREEGRLKGIELKKKDEEIAMLRKEAYGLSLETAMLKEEASALNLETVRLEEEIAKTKDKASDADREIVKAKLSAHMANSRIDRANDNTAIIEEDAKELRESSKKTTTKLHAQDVELTSNDFEMDFRLMDMEIAIEEMLNTAVPLPIRRSTTFAMSPYDMMKKLIINSHYEKEDMEYKISVYLRRDRITQDEADELRTLMLIFPPKN